MSESELQLDYQVIESGEGDVALKDLPEPELEKLTVENDGGQENPVLGEPGEADGEGGETATAGEASQGEEPVKFDERQQKVFNDEIAKRHKAAREAQREAEALRKRVAELEASTRPTRPDVPQLPDPYSVTEAEWVKANEARDKALHDRAVYDQQQQVLQAQRQELEGQQREQQRQEIFRAVETYKGRAEKSGIPLDILTGAGTIVGDELPWAQQAILNDEYGPQITHYLAQNPQEREKLASMDRESGLYYLGSTVRTKAAASVKPKVQAAPPPVQKPSRAATGDFVGLPGAKYF